ncbi:MAG: transposase, partial [Kosmotogaceae bacterium]|nr:transposase [Kosmotogaceae bacterium]
MLKNRRLSKAISDSSFHEFGFQTTYKQAWNGGSVLEADRFFPSSKTCSDCGSINEKLTLADRMYNCDCGLRMDRDLNASINLERYGILSKQVTSVSSTANARGGATAVSNPDEARIKQEVCESRFL